MKLFFYLTSAALAATTVGAFAPSKSTLSSSALSDFCNGYVGGEGPELNGVNFDPLKLSERAPEWVPWFREAELKHSRAAMLAFVGLIVPEIVRIPGEQFSKAAIPNVIEAHDALPDSMKQIFMWISLVEATTFAALANMNEYDRTPGDFSFDPLGVFPSDPEKRKSYQLAELKNGRLAMLAVGGCVTQAVITGKPFPYI
eukprot:CAMPEP_0118704098 /NCGR_PEP_ID=MMETSP0800-20121206/19011_1 /TAXON_ID=210618 ORGANISM="Striatella unipunctata, Strain CCMP2910" /NCGR_SAMPLE_ID=MMETSP0800 /ASSEMBLY_ACC=CAM_ASM_000638 /LENGTH=199 /DNA_ID=CAMNT_0006605879 /DNA_START=60 /DNA_END=659 /DNA_ORIENTATION=+